MKAAWRSPFFVMVAFLAACTERTGPPPPPPPPAPTSVAIQAGCWSASYNGYGTGEIGCGILNSLGDPAIDQAFQEEIAIQHAFWTNVPARVSILDECPGVQNALASPTGDILFGKNMFWDKVYRTGSTLPGAGVLAHEWAHQVQFRFSWMNRSAPTVRGDELEADAFSGFYMALAKQWAWSQISSFYATLYMTGDYHFNSPGHHGTPQERVAAGGLGVNTAIYAVQNGIFYTYDDLHWIFRTAIGALISPRTGSERAPELLGPRPPLVEGLFDYLERSGNRIDYEALVGLTREEKAAAYPRVDRPSPR